MTNQAERPAIIEGITARIQCGCGKIYLTLNFDEDKPFEVFDVMGKAGGCAAATSEAMARLLSWGLRSGASLEDAIKHLRGIQCHQPVHEGAKSCPDAIGMALEAMINQKKLKDGESNVPA